MPDERCFDLIRDIGNAAAKFQQCTLGRMSLRQNGRIIEKSKSPHALAASPPMQFITEKPTDNIFVVRLRNADLFRQTIAENFPVGMKYIGETRSNHTLRNIRPIILVKTAELHERRMIQAFIAHFRGIAASKRIESPGLETGYRICRPLVFIAAEFRVIGFMV